MKTAVPLRIRQCDLARALDVTGEFIAKIRKRGDIPPFDITKPRGWHRDTLQTQAPEMYRFLESYYDDLQQQ
jgi:hypothetical protein